MVLLMQLLLILLGFTVERQRHQLHLQEIIQLNLQLQHLYRAQFLLLQQLSLVLSYFSKILLQQLMHMERYGLKPILGQFIKQEEEVQLFLLIIQLLAVKQVT